MTFKSNLRSMFSAILREMERNPEFASRLEECFRSKGGQGGEDANTQIQAGKGRRSAGVLDPFAIFEEIGQGLAAKLDELTVEQLKDIVAEHGMDRSKLAMKWKSKEKLIPFMVKTVSSRLSKGDAFRRRSTSAREKEAVETTTAKRENVLQITPLEAEQPNVQLAIRMAKEVWLTDSSTRSREQLLIPLTPQAGSETTATSGVVEIVLDFTQPDSVEKIRRLVQKLHH